MPKTLKELVGFTRRSLVIGVVEFENAKYRLRLTRTDNHGIRVQMYNPADGKWFFVCGSLSESYDLEGLRLLLIQHYLSAGATIAFDGKIVKEAGSENTS